MAVTLKDKVVLITGASSGFGADAAHLFAREGAAVVLSARRIDRLQALAQKIQDEGGEALALPVDVSERTDIESMMQAVVEIYGRVDILFNNAGFGRLDFLENLSPPRDIETQVAVNLLGTIQVVRVIVPHMIARRQGHIINMASVAGMIGAPTYTVYAATKFGLRGFTESLRRELIPFGIKVSGIYPGPAVTEFGLHTGSAEFRKSLKVPGWTRMTSQQVARKVVDVAKRPRRSVIIPWWFHPIIWVNSMFPGLVDTIVTRNFTSKLHTAPPPREEPADTQRTQPPA
jgi:NADP-dependent 3-hydroxy acid dehydrogenase YdfG